MTANSRGVSGGHPSVVYGTENEPAKAALARSHVLEAFGEVPEQLSLLEGDLLETLPAADIPDESIDCVLLDIWFVPGLEGVDDVQVLTRGCRAPLALPTLKILIPKLRVGAVVFIDNTDSSADRYRDLLAILRSHDSGLISTTLPFSGGFEMCCFTLGH